MVRNFLAGALIALIATTAPVFSAQTDVEALIKGQVGQVLRFRIWRRWDETSDTPKLNSALPNLNATYRLMLRLNEEGWVRNSVNDHPDWVKKQAEERAQAAERAKRCKGAMICLEENNITIGGPKPNRLLIYFTPRVRPETEIGYARQPKFDDLTADEIFYKFPPIADLAILKLVRSDKPECDWESDVRLWFDERDALIDQIHFLTQKDGIDIHQCIQIGREGPVVKYFNYTLQ